MKKIIFLLFILVNTTLVSGQNLNDNKVKMVVNDSNNFEKTKALVNSKSFKFLAEWKQVRMGKKESTGGILNQLIISDDILKCHLQYDNSKSLSEPKSSDLIYDGEIRNYKLKINDKREEIEISYQIKFRANIFNIKMYVRPDGNTELDLKPTLGSGNILYYGKIESL